MIINRGNKIERYGDKFQRVRDSAGFKDSVKKVWRKVGTAITRTAKQAPKLIGKAVKYINNNNDIKNLIKSIPVVGETVASVLPYADKALTTVNNIMEGPKTFENVKDNIKALLSDEDYKKLIDKGKDKIKNKLNEVLNNNNISQQDKEDAKKLAGLIDVERYIKQYKNKLQANKAINKLEAGMLIDPLTLNNKKIRIKPIFKNMTKLKTLSNNNLYKAEAGRLWLAGCKSGAISQPTPPKEEFKKNKYFDILF